MTRTLGWSLAALPLLLVGIFFLPGKPLEVQVATVRRGPVEEIVSSTRAGTLKPRVQVVLGAQTAGRVVALRHRERERVAKGEPICLLDAAEWEARLVQAEQSLAAAEALCLGQEISLADAQRQQRRQQSLLSQRAVSEEDLDRAATKADLERSSLAIACARRDEARAALAVARTALEKTVVSAPFDGLVSETFVEAGQWVVPGTRVCEFLDDGELHVEADVDEIDSAKLAAGQEVTLTVDALSSERFHGVLSSVSAAVSTLEEKNRTVQVEVAWKADRAKVRPGMSVGVEVVVGRVPDALTVPSPAVMDRGGRHWVYVVKEGRALLREVHLGLTNWESTQVLSSGGVEEGEQVILSLGLSELGDGVRVRAVVAP
jgi:HlyD family secretion protein